jgi:hypothetical protein
MLVCWSEKYYLIRPARANKFITTNFNNWITTTFFLQEHNQCSGYEFFRISITKCIQSSLGLVRYIKCVLKNDRTFAMKTLLLILQHFKHCPRLQNLFTGTKHTFRTPKHINSIVTDLSCEVGIRNTSQGILRLLWRPSSNFRAFENPSPASVPRHEAVPHRHELSPAFNLNVV